jgi:predicted nucleotide-binding protein (sugar kinase/HSP70/actin superfamily)
MSDDKSKRKPQDAARINLREKYEVMYWVEELGVTKSELEQAVEAAGTSAKEVRAYLKKKSK